MPDLPRPHRRTSSLAPATVVVASGLTAWLVLSRHRLLAGMAAFLAAAALAAASDARAMRSARPAFAGRMLDRVFEACVLGPVAWVARQGSPRAAVLGLVGLGGSYLASYERARGEALGYREHEAQGFRMARWALLVFALLTGWIEVSLWAFVVLTGAASAVRAANVARQERRARLTRRVAG